MARTGQPASGGSCRPLRRTAGSVGVMHRARRWCRAESSIRARPRRSEEHTSELQSLMRISYAVFCLKKKKKNNKRTYTTSGHNTNHTTLHTPRQTHINTNVTHDN